MRTKLKKTLALFLTIMTMATVVVVSATATAAPAAAHNNACTNAPDSGPLFNFHDACHKHDECYGDKPYGNTSWGRKQCDIRFQNDMRGYCGRVYNKWWEKPSKQYCKGVAKTYYVAVRNYGSKFFYQAGPGTYPERPTVRAHRYSSSAGELTWNRAADPDGIVVKYEIRRNGRKIATVDALSLYQPNLRRGTYTYSIVSIDNEGKRSQPATVRLTI